MPAAHKRKSADVAASLPPAGKRGKANDGSKKGKKAAKDEEPTKGKRGRKAAAPKPVEPTPEEILEALQTVIMPMGGLAFRRGVQAWAAETGIQL